MDSTSNLRNKERGKITLGDVGGGGALTRPKRNEGMSTRAKNTGGGGGSKGVEVDRVKERSDESGVFGMFVSVPLVEQIHCSLGGAEVGRAYGQANTTSMASRGVNVPVVQAEQQCILRRLPCETIALADMLFSTYLQSLKYLFQS